MPQELFTASDHDCTVEVGHVLDKRDWPTSVFVAQALIGMLVVMERCRQHDCWAQAGNCWMT
eukprot:8336612-Lingulodinium_polyedra.AAC.1